MTPRREILKLLLGGLGAVASCRSAPRVSRGTASHGAEDRSFRDFGRRFLRDFRRAGARTYSEEGIPVFLVLEDRAGGAGGSNARGDAWAVALAADIRRAADVIAGAGLGRSEDDVGKVIEVFAERDFGALRREGRP